MIKFGKNKAGPDPKCLLGARNFLGNMVKNLKLIIVYMNVTTRSENSMEIESQVLQFYWSSFLKMK